MGEIGINVAKEGTSVEKLLQLNVQYIRIVADKTFATMQRAFFIKCHLAGIKVMLVFDSTSFNQFGNWEDAIRYYQALFGVLVDVWVFGNEPDAGWDGNKSFQQRQNENPSSWIMHGWEVNKAMQAGRQTLGNDVFIGTPGLCSGRADWLEQEAINLEWVNALLVHPYGQGTPTFPSPYGFGGSVIDLKKNYLSRMRPGQKFMISEWGVQGTEIPDNVAVPYCASMVDLCVADPQIEVMVYFCEDDAMVGNFGLYKNGNPKPIQKAFVKSTRSLPRHEPLPIPTGGPTPPTHKPRFQQGFEKLHAQNPLLFGDPKLYDEFGAAEFTSTQLTTTGTMIWCWLINGMKLHQFIGNDGRVFRWIEGTPSYEEIFPH